MKKQGFTLAELIGVIVIIAILALITFPTITNSLSGYKKKLCDTQVSNILTAAKNWGADHLTTLPAEGESLTITLSELIKQGYIDGDKKATNEADQYKIINPRIKKYYDPEPTITITKIGKKFQYKMDDITMTSCHKNLNNSLDGQLVIQARTSDNTNLIIPYTPIDDSRIKEYKCYYGSSASNVSNLGTIQNNQCIIPLGNNIHAKICALTDKEMNCTSTEKYLEYLIKDGVYQIPFTETHMTAVNKGSNYLEFIKNNSQERSGIISNNMIQIKPNTTMVVDVAVPRIYYAGGNTIASGVALQFGITSKNWLDQANDTTITNYLWKVFFTTDHQTSYNSSVSRNIYKATYDKETVVNGYLGFGRNSSSYEFTAQLYNIWLQY